MVTLGLVGGCAFELVELVGDQRLEETFAMAADVVSERPPAQAVEFVEGGVAMMAFDRLGRCSLLGDPFLVGDKCPTARTTW